jgi:hypothetical protein
MRLYKGARRGEYGTEVLVCDEDGGLWRKLNPKNDLVNHSPDGFEWGYGGSGPAQLAIALLADALNSDEIALKYYQKFKQQVVANIKKDVWSMTGLEVLNVVAKIVEDENK